MPSHSTRNLLILWLLVGACEPSGDDPPDAAIPDASALDAAIPPDAGGGADGGLDASTDLDAAAPLDAATDDSGALDAGETDAATGDSGTPLDASTGGSLIVELTGVGVVAIDEPDFLEPTIFCTANSGACSVPLAPGAQRTLTASSPSAFVGWGGACSGVGNTCTVTVDGPTTVSADFAPEPSGEWSLVLLQASNEMAMAFDTDGALFLATTSNLFKVSAAGEPAWTVQLPTGIELLAGLDTDSAGNVYFLASTSGGQQVYSFDGEGQPRWSRGVSPASCGTGLADCLVVTSDDTIATVSSNPSLLRVHASNGDTLWSETLARSPTAIDAKSSGDILAAVLLDDGESGEVLAFSPLGTPLASLAPRISEYDVSLAVAPDDSVIASSSGHSHVDVAWLSPDDPLRMSLVSSPVYTDHAVVVDSLGRPVTVHTQYPDEAPGILRVLDTDGSSLFERTGEIGDWAQLRPLALAADGSGRFAVAGQFTVRGTPLTWLGVYTVE